MVLRLVMLIRCDRGVFDFKWFCYSKNIPKSTDKRIEKILVVVVPYQKTSCPPQINNKVNFKFKKKNSLCLCRNF